MAVLLKSNKGCIKLETTISDNQEGNKKRVIPNAFGYYVKQYKDISKYRINKHEPDTDGNEWYKDYPKLIFSEDGENYQEWIFFGWFEDMECKTAISAETVEGTAFAKFYPISTTFVRGNADIKESMESSKSYYRIVARAPSLELEKVGAYFELPTGKKNDSYTTSVYANLIFETEDNTFYLKAKETDEGLAEGVVYTFKVNNVPQSYFDKAWKMMATYVTKDFTKVYGISTIGRMQDWFEGYINIPIYVNTEKKANNIKFKVRYNNLINTYVGFDAFASLTQDVVVTELEQGLLNVEVNSDEPIELIGNLVTLRFKVNDEEKVPQIITFNVFDTEVNKDNKKVNVSIPDAKYNKWALELDTVANKQMW